MTGLHIGILERSRCTYTSLSVGRSIILGYNYTFIPLSFPADTVTIARETLFFFTNPKTSARGQQAMDGRDAWAPQPTRRRVTWTQVGA